MIFPIKTWHQLNSKDKLEEQGISIFFDQQYLHLMITLCHDLKPKSKTNFISVEWVYLLDWLAKLEPIY